MGVVAQTMRAVRRRAPPMILSSLLPAAGVLLLVVGLAVGAMRCAGLAASLRTYDATLSAAAGVVALLLGGGALRGLLALAAQAMASLGV